MCDIAYRIKELSTGIEYNITVTEASALSISSSGILLIGSTYTFENGFHYITCARVISIGSTCSGWRGNVPVVIDADYEQMSAQKCKSSCAIPVNSCNDYKDCNTIIHEKFAQSAFELFNANKYGLKSCKITYDPYFLHDLMQLEFVLTELKECDKVLDCDCDYNVLCERIHTL